MIYLDTCALMKLVHPEGETAALRDFLKGRVTIPKFTATVALAELPRAVRRANHDTAGQPLTRVTVRGAPPAAPRWRVSCHR